MKLFSLFAIALFATGLAANSTVRGNRTFPTPTGTATPFTAPTPLYFSPQGGPRQPCTKRRPCDIDTGRRKLREGTFAQTLVFFGLTPEQISDLVFER